MQAKRVAEANFASVALYAQYKSTYTIWIIDIYTSRFIRYYKLFCQCI
jgi:hypothetical protein